MPPALDIFDLDSDNDDMRIRKNFKPQPVSSQQSLVPVIQRTSVRPPKARQYPDGPLPLRPSSVAPRKARITGRVADDDGVLYTLMVGQIPITEVKVTEILDYVSAWDLEEFENAQFVEEEENRKIAKLADEAEKEARRLRKLEKNRKKGIVLVEEHDDDLSSNDECDVVVGRHGRARPTYTHLYKLPGGGKSGGVRRRRKRDPSTGELMPLSDEDVVRAIVSSDDERDVKRAAERSEICRSSTAVAGLELPKRRRRKRDPVTGELMPLDGHVKDIPLSIHQLPMESRSRSSSTSMASVINRDSPRRSGSTLETERPDKSSAISAQPPFARSSPARKSALDVELQIPKRRRRKRDPRTGELLPLDPEPVEAALRPATPSTSGGQYAQQTEERKKRPRRRRHPITGELMPLGWIYDPKSEAAPLQMTSDIPSMQGLSIARESKRMKLTSEPRSPNLQQPTGAAPSGTSPRHRATQIVELSDSEVEEAQEDSSSMQLSIDVAPPKPSTQIRSPKHNMMQRGPPSSSSSDEEPITLASFLSTNAKGKARETSSSDSSSSSSAPNNRTKLVSSQKTSMLNPIASQPEVDDDDEEEEQEEESISTSNLEEGEFFVERIIAHHLSDPRTHPGLPQTMLYQTKWEGFDELTWEPAASFPDYSVVQEYRKRAGIRKSER